MTEQQANEIAKTANGTVYARAGIGEIGYGVSFIRDGFSIWVWEWYRAQKLIESGIL